MNKLLCLILLSLVSMPLFAGVVVIVHPSNADTVDQKVIENIFLGKTKTFPGGAQAVPVNLDSAMPLRKPLILKCWASHPANLSHIGHKKYLQAKERHPRKSLVGRR